MTEISLATAAQVAWEGLRHGDSKQGTVNTSTRDDVSVEDRLRLFHEKRDLHHDPFLGKDNFYRPILPGKAVPEALRNLGSFTSYSLNSTR